MANVDLLLTSEIAVVGLVCHPMDQILVSSNSDYCDEAIYQIDKRKMFIAI